MNAEIMNKIIKYMMDRPYKEVFELMDEIREAVKEANNGSTNEEHSGNE